MERVEASKTGDKISRDELEEGDEVILEWSPYDWAKENEGYVSRHEAEVDSIHSTSGDIRLTLPDGRTIKDLGGSRVQVMGPSENTDSVPDYTDVGAGIDNYYKK